LLIITILVDSYKFKCSLPIFGRFVLLLSTMRPNKQWTLIEVQVYEYRKLTKHKM